MESEINTKLKTNALFNSSSPKSYLREYSAQLISALDKLPEENLNRFFACLSKLFVTNKTAFVIGNGGSAAIADHLCCDFTKGTFSPPSAAIRTRSLMSHTALYTALANDCGFEHVFALQIQMYAEPGDILIAISSSGESKNIINGALAAKKKGMTVVSLTGFDGGVLNKMSDIPMHIPFSNYGVVEDAHQILMHCFAQFIKLKNSHKNGDA